MFSVIILSLFLISIPLYSLLRITTPYDDRIDDEQQMLFLHHHSGPS